MILSVEEIEKKLCSKSEETLNSLYFFYGEEKMLLENAVKNIKKKFGELVSGINFITIEETNKNELIADLQSPAFRIF